MGEIKIIETKDGGNTLYSEKYNATYHSIHGAMEESKRVFIELGLSFLIESGKNNIRILEMGFGSGLNAILSMIHAEKNKITIEYTGIEAFPVEIPIIEKLGYDVLFEERWQKTYKSLHTASWDHMHKLENGCIFIKVNTKMEAFETAEKYDLIYYDAFAPETQPELWSSAMMAHLYDMLAKGGVLTTYCAKGYFKRNLKEAGFVVESHPGPARKREITRALKF